MHRISEPRPAPLDAAAFHGLPGEFVHAVEPYSEADPAALLVTYLAAFGALAGDGPHVVAGGVHPPRLHVLVVGRTSKARKGSSTAAVLDVVGTAVPRWAEQAVVSGFGSGEAVVSTAASLPPGKAQILVFEPEFARILGVAARQGSTLTPILRGAWDTGRLERRVADPTKSMVITGAHVALVAHVTEGELADRLASADLAGGTINRLLMVAADRSRRLPHGARLPDDERERLASLTLRAVGRARQLGELDWTAEARGLWTALYDALADDDPPGRLGAAVARAEAQTLRLAVTYAAADGVPAIDVEHIAAAYAVWRYARGTAATLFGPGADSPERRLLAAIAEATGDGRVGLSRSAQRDLFGRNRSAGEVARLREDLLAAGWIAEHRDPGTGGRPRHVAVITEDGLAELREEPDLCPLPPLDALGTYRVNALNAYRESGGSTPAASVPADALKRENAESPTRQHETAQTAERDKRENAESLDNPDDGGAFVVDLRTYREGA